MLYCVASLSIRHTRICENVFVHDGSKINANPGGLKLNLINFIAVFDQYLSCPVTCSYQRFTGHWAADKGHSRTLSGQLADTADTLTSLCVLTDY